jgi:hypothetical protein
MLKSRLPILQLICFLFVSLFCANAPRRDTEREEDYSIPYPGFRLTGRYYGNFTEYAHEDTDGDSLHFFHPDTPFSSTTEFFYSLPETCFVKIIVQDTSGVVVDSADLGLKVPARYRMLWSVENLSVGFYTINLTACDNTISIKYPLFR